MVVTSSRTSGTIAPVVPLNAGVKAVIVERAVLRDLFVCACMCVLTAYKCVCICLCVCVCGRCAHAVGV